MENVENDAAQAPVVFLDLLLRHLALDAHVEAYGKKLHEVSSSDVEALGGLPPVAKALRVR